MTRTVVESFGRKGLVLNSDQAVADKADAFYHQASGLAREIFDGLGLLGYPGRLVSLLLDHPDTCRGYLTPTEWAARELETMGDAQ